jgi:cupin fold WbuC family metalloprotein
VSENTNDEFPRALSAPEDDVTVIDAVLIARVAAMARRSPRARIILPFHKRSDDTLQRMLNALQPGSYVTPHRHASPPKAESVVVLQGAVGFVTFTDTGKIEQHLRLAAGSSQPAIDCAPGIYHTFFALEEDTVLFEAKPGPYDPTSDKGFAPWAPAEGDEGAAEYLARLEALFPTPEK